MPACIGCDTTENLRRMNLTGYDGELDIEAFLGGPQYICPRCDADGDEMVAEFRSTPA